LTLRKLTFGEVLAGVAGALLIADLFAPWFGGDSAWSTLTVLLALLLVVAGLGIALLATTLVQRSQAYPVAAEVFGVFIGTVTTLIVLIELLVRDDPGWGAWVGLAAAAGVTAGSWLAMRADVRR
jgi:uncharacterized protein YhhL (DUF1145 family)